MDITDKSIFGILEKPLRIWAVGAIHGEAMRLRDLHEALLGRLCVGDRIVYLGNYFGIGPMVRETIDELIEFRRTFLTIPGAEPEDIVFLRGAQEEMWRKMLQIQLATIPQDVFDWMIERGAEATLRAYGGNVNEARVRFREGILSTTRWTGTLRQAMAASPGHNELMSSLRRAAYTDNGRLLFVHAGIDPNRPLSEQKDTFWWGAPYFAAIDAPFNGFDKVIRGFDPEHGGLVETRHTLSIDGGCGCGGELLAVCLSPEGEIIDRLSL